MSNHGYQAPNHPWGHHLAPPAHQRPRMDPWDGRSTPRYPRSGADTVVAPQHFFQFAPPPSTGFPPGPPTGWPAPPNPPRRRNVRTWALIGGIVIAVAAVIAAGGVIAATSAGSASPNNTARTTPTSTSPTTTTAPAAATVSVAQLPGLLPGPDVVGAVLGVPGLKVTGTTSGAEPVKDGDTVSDPQCLGAAYVGMETAYRGSKYTALRGQRIEDDAHIVMTVATAFPTAEDASAFLAKSTQAWNRCAGQLVTRHFTRDDTTESWTIGTPTAAQTSVSVVNYQEGGGGWACSHALAAKANVVIEATVCGAGMTDQGLKIVNRGLAAAPT